MATTCSGPVSFRYFYFIVLEKHTRLIIGNYEVTLIFWFVLNRSMSSSLTVLDNTSKKKKKTTTTSRMRGRMLQTVWRAAPSVPFNHSTKQSTLKRAKHFLTGISEHLGTLAVPICQEAFPS